jgi:hypothetical protein
MVGLFNLERLNMTKDELVSAMLCKVVEKTIKRQYIDNHHPLPDSCNKVEYFSLIINTDPLYHFTRDVIGEANNLEYYERETRLLPKDIMLEFDTLSELNSTYEKMVIFIEHIISNIEYAASFTDNNLNIK